MLLSLTPCKPKPLGVAYRICPFMRAWVNLLHYKKLEIQVWFTFIFIIDIYNEKSEDLSTILLSQIFILSTCYYSTLQLYLSNIPAKKKRERERQKKENYCLLLVSFVRCEIKVLVTQPCTCCFFCGSVVFVVYCLPLKEGHN